MLPIYRKDGVVMKKTKTIFLIVTMLFFTLFVGIKTNAKEKMEPNKVISIEKIYNNWDEAKKAGEYIHDEQAGLLKFKSAYRIGKTEKFKVTYVIFNE
jgi:hypothetical protein